MSWSKDWSDEVAQRLLRPFPVDEIQWKDTGRGNKLAYVDARDVQRRLDEAVGPGGWSFSWEAVSVSLEHVAVMGCLTVLGVQKCDAGEAHANKNAREPEELVKFSVSDALKRCAVQFGIGRALYEIPANRDGKVSEFELARAAEKTGYKADPPVQEYQCATCGVDVEYQYARRIQKKTGQVYCTHHGRLLEGDPETHQCAECKDPVPADIAQISLQKFGGIVMCIPCGKARVALEKSGVAVS